MSKKSYYKNSESLRPIRRLLDEASEGLKDENRTIKDSSMPSVLGAALGGGIGAVASYTALYLLGTTGLSAVGISSGLAAAGSLVGGGMVAGIGILATPVAILAVGGYAIVENNRKYRLKLEKENLIKDVIAKYDAIQEELKKRINLTDERVSYLEALVIALRAAIRDLEHDLGRA